MLGHAGLFYESDTDLWQQVAALMPRLLAHDGRWLYVADEHSVEAAQVGLGLAARNSGCGTVVAAADLRLREPILHPEAVAEAITGRLHAQAGRPPTLLIEMSWLIRTPSSSSSLREYEAAIDALARREGTTVICLYNQSILLDRHLLNGLHTHALICRHDGDLEPNPHFVPPALFAQCSERAQFHYWLQQLRAPSTAPAPTAPDPPMPSGQLQPIYYLETPSPLISGDGKQWRWQIGSLGQLRVYRANGELVQWAVPGGATYKTKTLFAYLLFRGEDGATAGELADLLWPEASGIEQSLNRLYHTVRCLRQALSPELASGRESPFVLRRDDHYYLAVPPNTWIDLPAFQEHCYRANQHQHQRRFAQSLQCYQSAKSLYRGDLLGDLPAKYTDHAENDWCWSRRYWFRNMYVKVLREMATLQRGMDNIPEALALCDEALRIEPTSDLLHQEKMRVLHAAKRRDALHRQYRLYCKALSQFELGEPTEATTRLYHALLENL
jgi:two-component SAPR family response regulator